jgi:hypothetical protein
MSAMRWLCKPCQRLFSVAKNQENLPVSELRCPVCQSSHLYWNNQFQAAIDEGASIFEAVLAAQGKGLALNPRRQWLHDYAWWRPDLAKLLHRHPDVSPVPADAWWRALRRLYQLRQARRRAVAAEQYEQAQQLLRVERKAREVLGRVVGG